MSIVEQVKRAAKDHGLYRGEIDDNWEPSHLAMYSRFCNMFQCHYTDYPTRSNQTKSFLEWLDNYKNPDYTDIKLEVVQSKQEGVNIKQLMPDKQPVNTDGVSRREAQAREAMVNENHIKNIKPAEPKEAPKNEVIDNGSNDKSESSNGQSNEQSSEQTASEKNNNRSGNEGNFNQVSEEGGPDKANEKQEGSEDKSGGGGDVQEAGTGTKEKETTAEPRSTGNGKFQGIAKANPVKTSTTIKTR